MAARYSAREQARIDAGECIDGCGSRDIPPVVVGKRWQVRRCKNCRLIAKQEREAQLSAKGCQLCKKRKRAEGLTHCAKCAEAAQVAEAEAQTVPANVLQVLSRKQRDILRETFDQINQRADAQAIYTLAIRLERVHRASSKRQDAPAGDDFRIMLESLERAIFDTDKPDAAPVLVSRDCDYERRRFDQYVSPIDA